MDTELTHLRAVDLGRAAAYPERPGGDSHGGLAEASVHARRAATALEPAFHGDGVVSVDPAAVQSAFDLGLALVATRSAHVDFLSRTVDNMDVHGSIADRAPGVPLERNDGYLVRDLEGCSAVLNALAGRLSVARSARVGVFLLYGSAPFPVERPAAGPAWVLPLNGDIIVRPPDGPPTQLTPGHLMSSPGWPRIHSHPSVCTLVVVEEKFTGRIQRDALLERFAHHPLLRVDAAIDPGRRVALYGLDGLVDYPAVVRSAAGEVVESSPIDLLRWWWVLARRLPPLVAQCPDGLVVRGRFPGGAGVLTEVAADDALVVRAGGHALAGPPASLEFLLRLVAGETVAATTDDERRSAAEVLAAGLAEPMVGEPGSILPVISGQGAA